MGQGSFIPSIDFDSCIIEEQENHLVIALRIPKATIAANLTMFGAMAKRCGGADNQLWSTRKDPPIRRWRPSALGGAALGAAMMVATLMLPSLASSTGHIITIAFAHGF